MNFLSRFNNPDFALLVTRLCLGGLFLVHGYDKFSNFGVIVTNLTSSGFAMPTTMLALITGAELLGGAAVLLGLFTEVGAALIALDMLAVFFLVQLPQGFSLTSVGFGFAAFAFGMSVSLFFSGAGKWALDHHIKNGSLFSVGTLYKK